MRRRIRIEHLWALAAITDVIFVVGTHPIPPNDFWWHVRAGQQIALTHAIPSLDAFSYTMFGAPYDNYAGYWLTELLLYGALKLGGPALPIFLCLLFIALAMVILLYLCYILTKNWRIAAAATFFAALLSYNSWIVRPQCPAFLFFAVIVGVIYAYRRRRRNWLLPVFPAIMLIWVNSHGTYVVGLVPPGVWLAAELWDAARSPRGSRVAALKKNVSPPAIALGLSVAACLLNPRGPGAVAHLMQIGSNALIRDLIVEWVQPTMQNGGGLFLTGLLFSAVTLAVSPRRPDAFELLTFLAFAALGLQANRFSPWFGMAMAPVIAPHLAAIASQLSTKSKASTAVSYRMNALLAGALLFLCVLSLPWFKGALPLPEWRRPLLARSTPVHATEYLLETLPPGRIFSDMAFSSYLIWAAPEYPVFSDTRIELFPGDLWQDYFDISLARLGWDDRLAEYGVNTLMLNPESQSALIVAAEANPGWQKLYADDTAMIFTRATP
jgi:hypothetical protein